MSLKAQNGWIFSPAKDACVFWLPLVGLCFVHAKWFPDSRTLPLFILYGLIVPFQHGHLWGTFGTVLRRRVDGRLRIFRMLAGPFAVAVFAAALYHYSYRYFFIILSAIGILHILRQQIGWVLLSRRLANEPPEERLMDVIETWNIMLPPVIWWFSPLSPAHKQFFGGVDLISLPATLALAVFVLHWFLHAAYLIVAIRRARRSGIVNWAKYSIMGSTWTWFFLGLVVDPTTALFSWGIASLHSLPYLMITQREMRKEPLQERRSPLLSRLSPALAFIVCFLAFGICLQVFGERVGLRSGLLTMAMYVPLMTHYYFDSFIWKRRNWLPQLQPGLAA